MNIAEMMKKAQNMQKKMQEMQASLEHVTEEGSAGAGMVTVTMSGKSEVKKVIISPDLLTPNDKEILEDLVVAAFNDAKRKIDAKTASEMEKIAGGLGLPAGMLPF